MSPEAVGLLSHLSLIERLTDTISKVLDPLIPRGRPVALLDFPQAPNVGDSLIWLGELAYLQRRGHGPPCYFSTSLTYDREALARRLGDGIILLSGGGNFGDLYPTHHGLRERVIADFPEHRIIQLPQSIHFDSGAAIEQAVKVLDRHPDLTLLLRDRPSLEFARKHFRAPSMLCPDMAFCIGPLSRLAPATQDVVWLSRADKESATRTPIASPQGVRPVDWVDDGLEVVVRVNRLLTRNIRFRPVLRPLLLPFLGPTYMPLLSHRLERGTRILSAGRVVATNRLHAYILSLLLGIPHFLSDNSYGKVRGFHEAWTRDCAISHSCDSEAEALRLAMEHAAR